jgi:hypothetical protein
MNEILLNDELLRVFKLMKLGDLGPCYQVRDAASSRLADALSADSLSVEDVAAEVVAVHRAAMALAVANALPTFGIVATAEKWCRDLALHQSISLRSKARSKLRDYAEPERWNLVRFGSGEFWSVVREAFTIVRVAGVSVEATEVLNRLDFLGYEIDASFLAAMVPKGVPSALQFAIPPPPGVTTVNIVPTPPAQETEWKWSIGNVVQTIPHGAAQIVDVQSHAVGGDLKSLYLVRTIDSGNRYLIPEHLIVPGKVQAEVPAAKAADPPRAYRPDRRSSPPRARQRH